MRWDAFLSYAQSDREQARQIYRMLSERGYRVFFDEVDIRIGESISVGIERALVNARCVLMLLSPHAFSSSWVELERQSIMFRDPSNRHTSFIPILLHDTELPPSISQFRFIDARDGVSEILIDQIQEALGDPAETEAPKAAPKPPSDEAKRMTLELTLNTDFDSFSPEQQERFLQAVEKLLGKDYGEVRISEKKRGSVRYRVTLEPDQAARLFLAVQNGELNEFKIGKASMEQSGDKIFIGRGRSLLWRELKDFISDRLRLDWDEFNRGSAAGITTSERLHEMLDQASFAFLVMTAEDEHADASLHARENVIHEVGLFQGKLGRRRAIVLLEEGCKDFSNIGGLGQIRFPKGNISACFEEVRLVLERETIANLRS